MGGVGAGLWIGWLVICLDMDIRIEVSQRGEDGAVLLEYFSVCSCVRTSLSIVETPLSCISV